MIINLESEEQNAASDDLSVIAENAVGGHCKSQNYLKKLWPECSWSTIKERIMVEGSAWYVFWMDGVNQHLANIKNHTVNL